MSRLNESGAVFARIAKELEALAAELHEEMSFHHVWSNETLRLPLLNAGTEICNAAGNLKTVSAVCAKTETR